MANNRLPTTTRAAVEAAVNADTELAEKARALAHKALDIADDYLTNGSTRTQLEVIRTIMPAIGRGMTDKGESEEIAELRVQIQALMRAMSGDESDVA